MRVWCKAGKTSDHVLLDMSEINKAYSMYTFLSGPPYYRDSTTPTGRAGTDEDHGDDSLTDDREEEDARSSYSCDAGEATSSGFKEGTTHAQSIRKTLPVAT